MSARCPANTWQTVLAFTGSLFFAISGSTVLNMIYDRDIDASMKRTRNRPLPQNRVSVKEALVIGIVMSALGISWAFLLEPLYGLVVVIWGGIAGGMPVLAGRVLGTGTIDWVGIILAVGVLLWIPTHILTFNLRHKADYKLAGVPTFPSTYGDKITQMVIAFSSIAAAIAMGIASYGIGMTWGYLRVLVVLSAGLLFLASSSLLRPSERLNFGLFKYASVYMMSSMFLVLAETF